MRLGAYEVEGELGRGAMGRVLRARHLPTGAVRALKVLDGPLDAEGVLRFRREAEALARVGGRGVVTVHEAAHEGATFFYAMDLMSGGSLGARLRSMGRLPWREAVAIVADLARTLARCHEARLVHRDLKPDNVLFDEAGAPLIADFGCARDLGARSLTETGAVLGTPAYMPPEQLMGEKVGPAADVFALGSILHELLTGERPHGGRTLIDLHETASRRRSFTAGAASGAPASVDALLARALEPDPARRPAASVFARDLDALLSGTVSRPRRGLVPAVIVAGAALTLVVGVAALSSRGRGASKPTIAAVDTRANLVVKNDRPATASSRDVPRVRTLVARALEGRIDPFAANSAWNIRIVSDCVAALEAARDTGVALDRSEKNRLLDLAHQAIVVNADRASTLDLFVRVAALDDEPTPERCSARIHWVSPLIAENQQLARIVAKDALVVAESRDLDDTPRRKCLLDGVRALLATGRRDDAYALIDRAAKDYPGDTEILDRRLGVLLESGRSDEVFREAGQLLAQYPADSVFASRLHELRARCQLEVRHDPKAALQELDRSTTPRAKLAATFFEIRALAETGLGDEANARMDFLEAYDRARDATREAVRVHAEAVGMGSVFR